MNKSKLDQEEQELLASFEADEFESDLTEKRKSSLSKMAEETSKKDKRINIRISTSEYQHAKDQHQKIRISSEYQHQKYTSKISTSKISTSKY